MCFFFKGFLLHSAGCSTPRERLVQAWAGACRSEKVGLIRKIKTRVTSPSALFCLPIALGPRTDPRKEALETECSDLRRALAARCRAALLSHSLPTRHRKRPPRLSAAGLAGRGPRTGPGQTRPRPLQCPRHQLQHCGNGAARPGGRCRVESAPATPQGAVCPSAPARGPQTAAGPRPKPSPVSPMMMYLKR
ncbi:uncharacterized protein LOC110597892 [Ictidomys tridecemlineatus]